MQDHKIVELFLQRDEAAIHACQEQYGARLRSVAYGILQNQQDAEECENDTYLEAWKAIPPHEPKTYLFAFLARITRCNALNLCRRSEQENRIMALSDEMASCIPSGADADTHLDAVQLASAISAFLRLQKEEKRNIFLRRYWYLDSISQIAQRYGIREGKVKMTLFRLRSGLREHLKKEGYSL